MDERKRIEALDSFRFIAILSVMLFHYYSLWFPPKKTISYYPYGKSYDFFHFGYLGVEFFFIISGFVIAFTLTQTDGFVEFWKKRFIRLFPSMLVCSVIILVVFQCFDSGYLIPQSHSFTNFLISLTFISTQIANKILSYFNVSGDYINGSYWSLWPEIQFYFVASCLYFSNKKNFIRNIAYFSLVIFWLNLSALILFADISTTNTFHLNFNYQLIETYKKLSITVFNYLYYSMYFLIGALFFQLYMKKRMINSVVLIIVSALSLLIYEKYINLNQFLPSYILAGMLVLFSVFILYPKILSFLTLKPVTSIGIASYSLYLIHEPIGILLINKYAGLFGKFDFLFPVLVILLLILFSLFSYKYIEKPVGIFLKKKLRC